MKKIISLIVIALMVAGSAYAATNISPGIGQIRGNGNFPSECWRTFRLVRNTYTGSQPTITPTLTKDSIVIWDTVSDDGVSITVTSTSGDSRVAGIVAGAGIASIDSGGHGNTAAQDIGKRNWGYIQTYGKGQADFSPLTVIAAGEVFGCGGSLGLAGGSATGAGQTETGANVGVAGFVMDAVTASATDIEVFLRGLE